MIMISRFFAALVAVPAVVACAPSGKQASEPTAPQAVAPKEAPSIPVEVVPDLDPATGLDRNVTYEPQVGPEPQERTRKDARESSPPGQ